MAEQVGWLDDEPDPPEATDASETTDASVPYATTLVHFATPEDRAAFQEAIGQRIPRTGRGMGQLWYPRAPVATWKR